jgi:hypothetical protein
MTDIKHRKPSMTSEASILTNKSLGTNQFQRSIAMNRRELLQRSAALGLTAVGTLALPITAATAFDTEGAAPNPLTPPSNGSIPVAFLISEGAVVIDFCGPVALPTRYRRNDACPGQVILLRQDSCLYSIRA